jgi:hypothetical protein
MSSRLSVPLAAKSAGQIAGRGMIADDLAIAVSEAVAELHGIAENPKD